MKAQFTFGETTWVADLDNGVDLSIPVVGGNRGVRCWGLDFPKIAPHQQGGFTGSVRAGAPVNFNDVAFNPHAHGTHTECMGHITPTAESVLSHPPPPWLPARLVSITPVPQGEDKIIRRAQLEEVLGEPLPEALVLRTLPNPVSRRTKQYSGTNPPYLEADAASWLRAKGVVHLLLDLPSVDREEDGGALEAHRAFWNLPLQPRAHATITELIHVPDHLADGFYVLNLQIAAFENDASPSRPILFPVKPLRG